MNNKKLCLFLVVVLTVNFLTFFSSNTLFVKGATSFSDGFESGDFSAWTGISGNPTVQSTIKYQDVYAALSDGSDGEFCYKTGISGLTTAYIRYYVYFSTKPTDPNFFDLFQTFTSSIDVNLRLYSDSFRVSVPGTAEYVSSTINPSINTWYCVELKIESGVGWILYINGVEDMNHSFAVTGTVTTLYIGGWSKVESSNIYWDDIVIANSYIGSGFSDGFESEDFSAWTDGGSCSTIITTDKHHGNFSACYNGSSWAPIYKDVSTAANVNFRAYVKFVADNMDDLENERFMNLRASNWASIAQLGLTKVSGSTYKWNLLAVDGGGYTNDFSSTFTLDRNHWYCIELAFFLNATAGYIKVFIDDVNVLESIDKDTTANGYIGKIDFCSWIIDPFVTYFDCVVISDTYIGEEPADVFGLSLSIIQPQNTFYTTNIIPLNCSLITNGTTPTLTYNIQYANGTWLYGSNQTYTTPTIAMLNFNSTATAYFDGSISEGNTANTNVTFTCYYYVAPTPTPSPTPDPNMLTPDDAVGVAIAFSVVILGVCIALIAAKRKKDE
jgi:hypothetical protein